ncbi:MAG: hypothetical protein IJ677_01425 [Alphaproteobacteria bacterium]|nr:hypothetical protein [Alphaproteobacteria bacterium]
MKIIKIQGCKKIKSLLGFAETVKQSSNYFRESVDALIFACRQKRHDTNGQSGRSMIEMLGVLAIIGILSIGGLAGYSKAIDRYRINETINQVTHIVQNTRDLFRTQKNFYGALSFDNKYMSSTSYANRKLADKAKIFPTALVKNNYKNLFEGEIKYYADGRFTEYDGKAFILVFYGIPQEACIELATRDWNSSLGLIVMRVSNPESNFYPIRGSYSGNCTTGYQANVGRICANDMPMNLDQAVAVCGNEKDNSVALKFY